MPEKVNMFGIPIQVWNAQQQADAPEGTIYVMMRVSDPDVSGDWADLKRRRTKTLCDKCSAPCWLDPKSYGRLPAHVVRICMQCVLKQLTAADKE